MGPGLTVISLTARQSFKEVTELATLNPLCCPVSRTAAWASEPAFHSWGLVRQLLQVINICPNSESLQNDSL